MAAYSLFIVGLPDSPWVTFQESAPEERSSADNLAFITLQGQFASIQQKVVVNSLIAESQPVVPPSEAGPRAFYRLARSFPDSDGDGLPDALEIASSLGDPFDADSNGNGVSDGAEDSDGDGFPNQYEHEGGSDPNDANSTPPPLIRYHARGLTFKSFTSTADSGAGAVGLSLSNELSTLGTSLRTTEPLWVSQGRNATLLFEDGSYRWATGTGSFTQAQGDFPYPTLNPQEEPFVNGWGWGKPTMVPIGEAKAAADEGANSTFSELEYRKDTTLQLALSRDLANDYRTRRQVPLVAVRRDGMALGGGATSTTLPSVVYPTGETEHRLLDFLISAQERQSNVELFDTSQYPLLNASEGGDTLHFFPLLIEGVSEDTTATSPAVDESSGVDRISLSAEPNAGGFTDRLWVMVPAGGSNRVRVATGAASPDLPVKLIAGSTITSPATLTKESETIEWSAPAAAASSEHALQLQFGDAAATEVPIGIHIMEKRVIEIAIHPIARQTATGTAEPPTVIPTEAELTEYLNLIYLDQINLECNVEVLPIETVDWDIADGRQAGPSPHYTSLMVEHHLTDPASQLPPPPSSISVPSDLLFDILSSRSPEQSAVISGIQDTSPAHIHVFLLGGISRMRLIGAATGEQLDQAGIQFGLTELEKLNGYAAMRLLLSSVFSRFF